MRLPERPIVTAGLGVVCALALLLVLSWPALTQFSASNMSAVPGSGSVLSTSTTGGAADTITASPTTSTMSSSSTATLVYTTTASSSTSFSTPTSSALNSINTNSGTIVRSSITSSAQSQYSNVNGTSPPATTYVAPSSTMAQTTTTQEATTTVTTVAQSSTSFSNSTTTAAPQLQASPSQTPATTFTPSLFGSSQSAIVDFANKFAILGVLALVLALGSAFVVYRKVNSADEEA